MRSFVVANAVHRVAVALRGAIRWMAGGPADDNPALMAEKLERRARLLWDDAAQLRRAQYGTVRLQLDEFGQVTITHWKGGRLDSSYRPMSPAEALEVITPLVQGHQPESLPSSSDAHAH